VFVELMPLLAGRTVLTTIAREDEKTLRVNMISKKVKDDEDPALITPLSYTGTPEELGAELGKHLASYVECHTQLGGTLAQAKAEMEAAAKAAQEEARRKSAERNKKPAEKAEAAAGDNSATPQRTGNAAVGSNTLFGSSTPAGPAVESKPTGDESTCRLAL
jgi:PRTRC genetic system protein E